MAIGIGAAILGSAVLGAAASYLGGKSASKGNDAAINTEWQMFNQAREDYAPWRQAGQYALEQLIGKPGTPGTEGYWTNPATSYPVTTMTPNWEGVMVPSTQYMETAPSGWVPPTEGTPGTPGLLQTGPGEFRPEQDPGYKFGYQEFVEKPTLQLASATGKLRSSDMLQNLTRYASDYASTKYDNFLQRYYQKLNPLFELSKMGAGAASGSASASTAAGGNLANLATNQGNINAGMVAGMGGAAQQGLSNYMNYKILEKYYPPGASK